MSKKQVYTGFNIQYPISQKIISGEKTVETRTYPLPSKYVQTDLLLIETPGPTGKFKSRAIALIRFKPSFKYKDAHQFYADSNRHCVTKNSPWRWEKIKYGWEIEVVKPLDQPREPGKRIGIIFTKNLTL